MWMGRHDYVLDGQAIRLVSVALSEQLFGNASEVSRPIAAVPVGL